eukprot:CAMPEP_0115043302 /NCGR_PEP_ID=MMETSP0216-20121206/46793_1 /TAXON_ID=223996 /ORGANISM="Protocruzia adherens, Strain Boccale" /LENGTH=163 /DNA_ID=CAMNT_0002425607 /DNA_START=11 /DNA_END=502 /DNA_ORIENTATION=-
MKFTLVAIFLCLVATNAEVIDFGEFDLIQPEDFLNLDLLSHLFGSSSSVPFTNCMTGGTLHLESLDLTPNPPVKGQTVSGTAKGTSDVAQTITHIKATASFDGIKLHTWDEDLKKPVSVKAGPATYTASAKIPSYAPKGTYKVHAEVYAGSVQAACVEVQMKL